MNAHRSNSVVCNSSVLIRLRQDLGWTQFDLAVNAGYSERLVRKAEAGKPIAQRTICGLRDAFRQAGQKITLDELLQNPVLLAGQFLKQLFAAGSLVISRSADFIDADATFEFAGNPSVFAFSGQHHGTAAACQAFEAFSRHFQLPRPSAAEHFQVHATGHGAIAWGNLPVTDDDHSNSLPIQMAIRFDFHHGKLRRYEHLFDTHAAASQSKLGTAE